MRRRPATLPARTSTRAHVCDVADQALEQGEVGGFEQIGPGVEEEGGRQPPLEDRIDPQGIDHRQEAGAIEGGGRPLTAAADLPHGRPEEVEVGLQVALLARGPLGRAHRPQLGLDGGRDRGRVHRADQTSSRLRQSESFWRTWAGVIRSVDSGTLSTIWRWSQ